jgi:methionyl-tRNA formyltransferase
MDKIRVVFMGTPEFSVPVLKMLIAKTDVVMVVTQPDKEVGRKKELEASPVKKLALEHNIAVFQPAKIRQDFETIVNIHPDLLITCAYGQIIPKELLECTKYGAINIHASLLPKYRGSAPINWSIINGDEKTGITLMYMDEHMDTGDMIKWVETKILENETYGSLYNRLSKMGSKLLEDNLEYLVSDDVKRYKQDDEKATLAPMIKRDIELLDFNECGKSIINKIRGLNPSPLAYTLINGEEFKIIEADFEAKAIDKPGVIVEISKKRLGISCKDGIIYPKFVKPFGKKQMDIISYLNGIDKEKLMNIQVG